jgi:hypothetical protein
LLENYFELVGKGGWPPISTWIKVTEQVLNIQGKNELASRINEIQVTMAAKTVEEKLHMRMDERGSSLQRWVLPKAEVGVSQDFTMQFERTHGIPGDCD